MRMHDRRPSRRRILGAAAAALGGAAALPPPRPALAFSERSVRWIVAFPAGGGSDALARLIGQPMGERLG